MTEQNKIIGVAACLQRLKTICDTGYALAVHIRYTRPSLLYRSYHQAWIDHYSESGFMLQDPVVHWGLGNVGAISWADLTAQDSEGVLRDALAHGLTNGWTYAIGPATTRTIAGLTKTGEDFTAAQRADVMQITDEIHTLTEGFDSFSAQTQLALRALT